MPSTSDLKRTADQHDPLCDAPFTPLTSMIPHVLHRLYSTLLDKMLPPWHAIAESSPMCCCRVSIIALFLIVHAESASCCRFACKDGTLGSKPDFL